MLTLPTLRNSPLVEEDEPDLAAGAILAPMMANGEVLGVIAFFHRRRPDLNPDYLAAIQHLANQAAASLRLQEQRLMKEQLLRSEKMAAAGQLISGVANDLRAPLANIARASRQVLERAGPDIGAELREVSAEADRGMELIDHLLSLADMQRREPKLVDVNLMVSNLLDLRAEEQKHRGIHSNINIPLTPVNVIADQAQLEQAFITAVVQAEHAALNSPEHLVNISSRVLGNQIQFVFESAAPASPEEKDESAADNFGFPVAQAIVQTHGGELRNTSVTCGCFRLELALPIYTLAPSTAPADDYVPARRGKPTRVITAVILDPDSTGQRRLIGLLAARGHRVIPAGSPEEVVDLVQRMHFDVVFCAAKISGLTWVELFQRVRRRVDFFTLLTEDQDPYAVQAFATGEGQVLARPVQESALDNLLGILEVRLAVTRR